MKQIEVERKTVDEAIQQGLEELGLSLEEVRIDVLEEGSKGIFGLIGVKNARVRLTVREEEAEEAPAPKTPAPKPAAPKAAPTPAPAAQAQPRQPAPAPKAEGAAPAQPRQQERPPKPQQERRPEQPPRPRPPRDADEGRAHSPRRERERDRETNLPLEEGEADATLAFVRDVSSKMGVDVTAEASEREGTLHIDILGDEKGILIGHRGETLDALQYLVGLVHNKERQQYRRVQLDSQNYRKKREETLVRLANRLADKARRTGHRVTLEPMNPYERRIMHSALQGNPYVTTQSEGEEPNRRVVILPKQRERA